MVTKPTFPWRSRGRSRSAPRSWATRATPPFRWPRSWCRGRSSGNPVADRPAAGTALPSAL